MTDLIARLEAAESGSRELDALIDLAAKRGQPYKPAQFGRLIPEYSTSLDANLPGENIAMITAPGRSQPTWTAWQSIKREEGDLRPAVVIAHANTEALARRAAALKAR